MVEGRTSVIDNDGRSDYLSVRNYWKSEATTQEEEYSMTLIRRKKILNSRD